MKVYCHKSVNVPVDDGTRCYIAGNLYELDPNEDFNSLNDIDISMNKHIFVFTGIIDKKYNKSQGCRFTLANKMIGTCEVFSDYFYDNKELRKMKLKKLKNV